MYIYGHRITPINESSITYDFSHPQLLLDRGSDLLWVHSLVLIIVIGEVALLAFRLDIAQVMMLALQKNAIKSASTKQMAILGSDHLTGMATTSKI